MTVKWDGMKRVRITLPPAMHGHVCGMCGPIEDYTGDMLIGPHDNSQQNEPYCPAKAAGLPHGAIVSICRYSLKIKYYFPLTTTQSIK